MQEISFDRGPEVVYETYVFKLEYAAAMSRGMDLQRILHHRAMHASAPCRMHKPIWQIADRSRSTRASSIQGNYFPPQISSELHLTIHVTEGLAVHHPLPRIVMSQLFKTFGKEGHKASGHSQLKSSVQRSIRGVW